MAVKKTQMYRRNLDGTETGLNPLTESQYVLMENGQTVQEVLSDRDSDKYTPVITNSSSTFKVGQGDNVDLSSSMKEGAYDSCVLKGKTMVNCIQEPSSQDVVLPYAFADGQYVTINDTKESGALGVELKGQTLVNVHGKKAYSLSQSGETIEANKFTNIVKGENQVSFDMMDGLTYGWGSFVNGGSLNLDMLKPNTKYLAYFGTAIFPEYFGVSFRNGDGTNLISTQAQINKGGNYAIITTTNEIVKSSQILYISIPQQHAGHYGFKDIMVIEYQEGMENWDIPHFEGMTSCKMPTLHTVGKNLYSSENLTVGKYIDNNGALINAATDVLSDYIRVKPNTRYAFKVMDDRATSPYGVKTFFDSNKNFITRMGNHSSNETFTTPKNCHYVRVHHNAYTQCGSTTPVCMLIETTENPSTITSHEPYKSSILSLPEEVVLRSLPNGVCDTFNTRTGVYTQRIGDDTFIGASNENWRTPNNYTTGDTMPFRITKPTMQGNGSVVPLDIICDKMKIETPRNAWGNDGYDGEGLSHGTGKGDGVDVRILKSKLPTEDVAGFKQWLSQNPIRVQYQLHTPIITKVNLSSTLKSWNTTTHIYSEIPENSLYPILSHSNPTYPVILKPSTKYSIVANSYSNGHTNAAINFNLGGATASTTVGNRVTTITTPSTLSNELLTMSGRGNKLNNVMVIEGDVVGDEPYFEGICDVKSPILSNVGKNLFNINGAWEKCSYSMGIPCITYANPKIDIVSQKEFTITTDASGYNNGFGQYIDISTLDEITVEATASFSDAKTSFECKILLLQEGEGLPSNVKTGEDKNFTLRTVSTSTSGQRMSINIDTSKFTKMFIMFSGGWKSTMNGSFIFTMQDVYVGDTNQTYEPYKSNVTTFDQKDDKTIVLRSLPNGVCDTLNVETGEYVQRIGELVANGDDTITYSGISTTANNTVRMVINHPSIQINPNETVVCAYCDRIKYQYNYQDTTDIESFFVAKSNSRIFMRLEKSKLETLDVAGIKKYLSKTPYTFQYELIEPIVSTIDVQGFPYAYTNGHVQLSFGSIEQSLTPTVEYSLSANKTGQINSNTKRVSAHQKQLDDFEAMMLTQMVQSAYDKAILQFDYEMQLMSLGGE